MSEVAFSFDRIGTALVLGIGIPVTLSQAYPLPSQPAVDIATQIKGTPSTLKNHNVSSAATVPSHPIGDTAEATNAVTHAALPIREQPVPIPPDVAPVAEQGSVVVIAPAPITWAPSFDCAKVSIGSERLICLSKELSEADVNLAVAYKAATKISADKDSLRNAQNAWRKNERDACSDVQCMRGAYQSRLAQLTR